MLQIYDKVKSTSLLALAAAGGLGISAPAMAEKSCTAQDGYASDLSAYVAEATACIAQSDQLRSDLEADLGEQISFARASLGLSALEQRDSLQTAARAHALDMAARDYVAHKDPEGRSHKYRMGVFDRSMLVSASGANVMTMAADTDSASIFNAMGQDVQNAKNVVHQWFTDYGVGVVQTEDVTYVVVLFAASEGELDEALPLTLAGKMPVRADLKRGYSQTVGWTLQDDQSGEMLSKSTHMSLRDARLQGSDAARLNIIVNDRADIYSLSGPVLSAR